MDCKDVTEFIACRRQQLLADVWAAKERFADHLSDNFRATAFGSLASRQSTRENVSAFIQL